MDLAIDYLHYIIYFLLLLMNKKTIIAAGGLVFNEQNELLMIFRRGKWDLPKGKLDAGETVEACAVREVQEETGLITIELENLIGKTYHEYFDKWVNENVVKESWWYKMKSSVNEKLIPQVEEDIELIEWVDKKNFKKYLDNSYRNISEIVNKYYEQIIT